MYKIQLDNGIYIRLLYTHKIIYIYGEREIMIGSYCYFQDSQVCRLVYMLVCTEKERDRERQRERESAPE